MNTYLELEKARFEEKLQVTMDIRKYLTVWYLPLSFSLWWKISSATELIEMGTRTVIIIVSSMQKIPMGINAFILQ